MTTKKVMKVIVAILLASVLIMMLSQITSAYNAMNPDESLSNYRREDTSGASAASQNIIGMIINIAQVIGTGVAIVMLIVLAIQYIAASPEGKAEIKKNSTIYIVGAVILFAASGILGIVRRFAITSINEQGDV